jgi:hypothetical protein
MLTRENQIKNEHKRQEKNMNRYLTTALFIAAGMLLPIQVSAQDDSTAAKTDTLSVKEQMENLKGKVDGINEDYLATKSTVDKLGKIKISGYTQFQYRMAASFDKATDTSKVTGYYAINNKPGTYLYPVGDFAGGKFGAGISDLFQLRRARVKFAYEQPLTQGVIQVDFLPFTMANSLNSVTTTTTSDTIKDSAGVKHIVPKTVTTATTTAGNPFVNGGGVTVKDAYLRFTEPWFKLFSVKGGIFNRPFGFEISYSSGDRETPERSRTEQTLFPGERDMGVSLEVLPSDNMPQIAQWFNARGGVFTGNGINVESDAERDYMGRLGVSIPFRDLGLGIDAGGSGYYGHVLSLNDAKYAFNADTKLFDKTGAAGATSQYNKAILREYFGQDAQIYYSLPVVGGLTLRAEAYEGTQPAFATSTSSLAGPSSYVANSGSIYSRNFIGYYLWWVQNIDPINSQFVLKYDSYDPNTDIVGTEINAAKIAGGVSTADIQWNTLGVGWVYHWDENVKFIAYYEKPTPEKVNKDDAALKTSSSFWVYTRDINADVFTFRVQYKF